MTMADEYYVFEISQRMVLTTSSMWVTNPIAGEARWTRSPSPVREGRYTLWPRRVRRMSTRCQSQLPHTPHGRLRMSSGQAQDAAPVRPGRMRRLQRSPSTCGALVTSCDCCLPTRASAACALAGAGRVSVPQVPEAIFLFRWREDPSSVRVSQELSQSAPCPWALADHTSDDENTRPLGGQPGVGAGSRCA